VRRRAVVRAIATAACALVLTAPAASAQGGPDLTPAARTLSQCLQSSDRLSLVILVDESESLQGTDAADERVPGLKALLLGLLRLSHPPSGGNGPEVDVLFAGFHNRVTPRPEDVNEAEDWRQVTPDAMSSLIATAESFEDRDEGRDTDYGTALTAVDEYFERHSESLVAGGDDPPCRALVWFTDGRYQVTKRTDPEGRKLPRTVEYAPGIPLDSERNSKRVVAAGTRYLCREGGLMDQLADHNVVKFTVALTTKLQPDASVLLDALTTGAAGDEACGSQLSHATGSYLRVKDSGELFFTFSSIFGTVPPPVGPPVCVPKSCPAGQRTFETLEGVSSFVLHASTGADDVEIHLTGPSGSTQVLKPGAPGSLETAGTDLNQRWVSLRAVEVLGEFDRDNEDWLGRWTIAFVSSAPANRTARPVYRLQLFTDHRIEPVGSQSVTRGEPTRLRFRLVDRSGKTLTGGPLLPAASLTGTMTDPTSGRSTPFKLTGPSPRGEFTGTVVLSPRSAAAYVFVDLDATFGTPDGTSLVARHRSLRLLTEFPESAGYPKVTPTELAPPKLEGTGPTRGKLTVTGSRFADGCVWIENARLDGPDGAGAITAKPPAGATSATRCLRVRRGERRELTVTFEADHQAIGFVEGSLPVHLLSSKTPGERTVQIEARFPMDRPDSVWKWLIILGGILGTAFPLLLLHGLNTRNARFAEPGELMVLERDVKVSPYGGLESADGGRLDVTYTDFAELPGARHGEDGLSLDLVELRPVASGSVKDRVNRLFQGPYGVATARDRPIVAGASQPLSVWRDGTAHEVPLALSGTWIFYSTAEPAARDGSGSDADAGPWEPPSDDPEPEARSDDAVAGKLLLVVSRGATTPDCQALLISAEEAMRTQSPERLRPKAPEPEPKSADQEPDGRGYDEPSGASPWSAGEDFSAEEPHSDYAGESGTDNRSNGDEGEDDRDEGGGGHYF
jgi:hypothetical protein